MAEPTAKFSFSIEADTAGADKAADSLDALQQGIQADVGALRQMQRALTNLKGSSQIAEGSIKALRDKIDAQKTSIAVAQKKFIDLGGTFKATKPPTASFAGFLAEAKAMPGPIGRIAAALSGQSKLLTVSRIGMLAVAAATVVGVAALAAMSKALATYGIAHANARRDELLRLEGLTKIRSRWGIAGGSAKFLQEQIDAVSDSVALGRDQVAGYATQLHRMGLRGEALKNTLEGMGIVGATQGEEMAQRFAGMAAGAALTGQSVKKLSDDVKARLGGIAKAQMLSLGVQAQKLKENFGKLFDGLKIEKLLDGLKTITDLFSKNTESGKALASILEGLMQPIVDGVAYVAPIVKRFFQGVILGVLDLQIIFYKLRNAVRDAFGGWRPPTKETDDWRDAVKLVEGAVVALGVALTALTTAAIIKGVIALGGALWTLAAPVLVMAAPFLAVAAAAAALGAAAYQAYKLWEEIDWGSLGTAIVDGIEHALLVGVGRVLNAVGSMADKIKTKFKNLLGISSPSKVFANFGGNLTSGLSAGLDRGRPEVVASTRNVANAAYGAGNEIEKQGAAFTKRIAIGGSDEEPTTATPSPRAEQFVPRVAPGTQGPTKEGPIVRIERLEIHAKSDNPQDLALQVKEALEQVLAGVAVQVGA